MLLSRESRDWLLIRALSFVVGCCCWLLQYWVQVRYQYEYVMAGCRRSAVADRCMRKISIMRVSHGLSHSQPTITKNEERRYEDMKHAHRTTKVVRYFTLLYFSLQQAKLVV